MMLRDEYGYCVACFDDPCSCFLQSRESQSRCQHCAELRAEISALRALLQKTAIEDGS